MGTSRMTPAEAARVAAIMARSKGVPEGDDQVLDPEYAVFGRDNEVLRRGLRDPHTAEEVAATWRTTYYRPDAWSGQLCNDYRDHPREICGEQHELD